MYSDCGVLRYSKSQLECRLYVSKDCMNSADADSNIYMRRNTIDEAIGGNCLVIGCPPSNRCVMLNNGMNCFPDRVLTQYADYNATFMEIDGMHFGMYPLNKTFHDAHHFCISLSGRLAVLDTPRKLHIIRDNTQRRGKNWLWFVGATRAANGAWLWSNGVPANLDYDNNQADCGILVRDVLDDFHCTTECPFVCEML